MDTRSPLTVPTQPSGADSAPPPASSVATIANPADPPRRREAPPVAAGYLLDPDSEEVVRRAFIDFGVAEQHVAHGSIDTATAELKGRGWPHFLVVDVSGIADPMLQINRLADTCDPATEVIVVGDRNDIVLYRDLKAAGVAEYFFKPLVSTVIARTLTTITNGTATSVTSRSGRLIFVVGVRGGVGVTTIATNAAWYLAEARERRVLLVDLDLHSGDVALQLNLQPSHALRQALEAPDRVDDLFLERGLAKATERLDVMAALEPLSERVTINEAAVGQLLQELLTRYRYVIVDLPRETALSFSKLLHMPSTLLLVSDGGISSAREVARWREKIGPNSPERSLLHVLNKKDAVGALPEAEFLRLAPPPELSIEWQRDIGSSALIGIQAVQKCTAMRQGMAALSLELSGGAVAASPSLWKRMFA